MKYNLPSLGELLNTQELEKSLEFFHVQEPINVFNATGEQVKRNKGLLVVLKILIPLDKLKDYEEKPNESV